MSDEHAPHRDGDGDTEVGVLEFRVLGPVQARREDWPLTLPGPRGRAVLAALLLDAGAVCSVSRLSEVLWDDEPPNTAVTQVQIVISRLRTALRDGDSDGERLITANRGYLLRLGDARLDLTEFRHCCQRGRQAAGHGDWDTASVCYADALRQWRGDPCQDVASPVVERMAAPLADERTAAVEQQSAVNLLAGRFDEAVDASNQALTRQPLSERLHQLLVLGHALAGRTGAALDAYRSARRVLDDDLGVAPGHDLAQAQLDTLRATPRHSLDLIREWFPGAGTTPPTPAPTAAPMCQLPADLSDFVGREAELDRLAALLDTSGGAAGPRVVSLYGMAGVGKTTLALRAARTLTTEFGNGCLYVELRGADADNRTPYKVLGSLLRSLGMSTSAVPADLDARQALYRSMTAEAGLLVVVDDAWDERQVRPLVPGSPAAAVLVTSRRPLSALDNVATMRLDVAPMDDALQLLENVLGRCRNTVHEPDARRIVALCERLPLAIRLAAARLAQRGTAGLAWLADRLTDEQGRLDQLAVGDRGIRSSLAASYRRLPTDAARLLRSLSLLPAQPLPAWLLDAALGEPAGRAEGLLDTLLELQFVQLAQGPAGDHRYRMHDLVRLFVGERCREEDGQAERSAAIQRAYHQLILLAGAADAAIAGREYPTPVVADHGAAPGARGLEFFDAERDLLASAVGHASELAWPDVAWRLAAVGTNAATQRGFIGEWRVAVGTALECLDRCDAHNEAGRAALQLAHGMLHRAHGETRLELPALRAARLHYRRLGDDVRAGVAATEIGVVARVTGRRTVARAAAQWALQHLQPEGPPQLLARVYLSMGNLDAGGRGAAESALRYYDLAEAGFRAGHDRTGLANTLSCRGLLLMSLDRLGEAVDQLRAARAILAQCDDAFGQAMVACTLAIVYRQIGRLDEAYELAIGSLGIMSALQNPYGVARANNVCGAVLIDMGHPRAAIEHLENSVAARRRMGTPLSLARSLFMLAMADAGVGDTERGRQQAIEAHSLYQQSGHNAATDVARWLADDANGVGSVAW